MAVGVIEQARAVHGWLEGLNAFFLEVRTEAWLVTTYKTLLGIRRTDAAAVIALKRALDQWAKLHEKGRDLALKGVDPGDAPIDDQALDAAISRFTRGERPFGIFAFGSGALKERIGRVRVNGSAPVSQSDWREVMEARGWQRDA